MNATRALLVLFLLFGGSCLTLTYSQQAPNFSAFTTKGDSIRLYDDYLDSGKVVMIEFFFTSCPPCKEYAPFLENRYQQWRSVTDKVEYLLITTQGFDSNSAVQQYLNQYSMSFAGIGEDGGASEIWSVFRDGRYGTVFGTPVFLVIAADGSVTFNIREASVQATLDQIDTVITQALASSPDSTVTRQIDHIDIHPATSHNNLEAFLVGYPTLHDTTRVTAPMHGTSLPFPPGQIVDTQNLQVFLRKPEHPAELLNGINTIDIAFLIRYILGFDQPNVFQFEAADVNQDGKLSGQDVIIIRQMILGQRNSLPDHRSPLQFYPDYQVQSVEDSLAFDAIWDFPQEFSYISDSVPSLPFRLLKIGDVNGSYIPTANKPQFERGKSADTYMYRLSLDEFKGHSVRIEDGFTKEIFYTSDNCPGMIEIQGTKVLGTLLDLYIDNHFYTRIRVE